MSRLPLLVAPLGFLAAILVHACANRFLNWGPGEAGLAALIAGGLLGTAALAERRFQHVSGLAALGPALGAGVGLGLFNALAGRAALDELILQTQFGLQLFHPLAYAFLSGFTGVVILAATWNRLRLAAATLLIGALTLQILVDNIFLLEAPWKEYYRLVPTLRSPVGGWEILQQALLLIPSGLSVAILYLFGQRLRIEEGGALPHIVVVLLIAGLVTLATEALMFMAAHRLHGFPDWASRGFGRWADFMLTVEPAHVFQHLTVGVLAGSLPMLVVLPRLQPLTANCIGETYLYFALSFEWLLRDTLRSQWLGGPWMLLILGGCLVAHLLHPAGPRRQPRFITVFFPGPPRFPRRPRI